MNVNWLGQSGYLLESAGQRLLIDPFYSNIVEQLQGLKRLMEPPIPLDELHPDVIFITHDHIDHFDPIALPQIHQTYPETLIAGPASVIEHARKLGFNEAALVPMPSGSSATFGQFTLHTVPAYHSDPLAVGCVLQVEGRTIYVSGDTLLKNGLIDTVRGTCSQPIDMVFIVINGRLGNMNIQEAVEVVSKLNPRLAIPMHYGMFAENTADPYEFAEACRRVGIDTQLLTPGEWVDL